MHYISVKGDVTEVYIIQLFHKFQCSYLVERSDKSHAVYPRAAFMTVFALLLEAIIQGWLPHRLQLLTSKLWYLVLVKYCHCFIVGINVGFRSIIRCAST